MGADETAGGAAVRGDEARSADQVGARISALLNAAEEAAEQIRADARADAETLLRDAEERARARVEELTGEPERLVADAEREAAELRAAAEADALRTRKEAEAAAAEQSALAERDAAATRRAAEQVADEVERQAQRRHRELRDGLKEIEETRQRALHTLQSSLNGARAAVAELEGLVAGLSREPAAAADDGLFGRSRRTRGLSWRSVLRHEQDAVRTEQDDVYEALEGAVEKVGGRWVPKQRADGEPERAAGERE